MKLNIHGFLFLVYSVSAFILYYGTMYFPEKYDPSHLYGMADGKHPHLQRTVGMLLLMMAILNGMSCVIQNQHIMQITIAINALFGIHYFVETFYFHALSLHFMSLLYLMIGLNTIWSCWSYFRVAKME